MNIFQNKSASMLNEIICPFCMKTHPTDTQTCPKNKTRIPRRYRDLAGRGVPVLFFVTAGYSGVGKSCFLGSLLYTLREEMWRSWENFSSFGLNTDTTIRIQNHIDDLKNGQTPEATEGSSFPIPLIELAQNIPFFNAYGEMEYKQLIMVMYDVGGEVYNDDETVCNYLEILKNIKNIILLFDLHGYKNRKNNERANLLENIVATITNALYQMDADNRKNVSVFFTKSDLMKNAQKKKTPPYGPLSNWEERYSAQIPAPAEIKGYMKSAADFSKEIQEYIKTEHRPFYNMLINNFNERTLRFGTFSALGHNPDKKGRLSDFEPQRVLDPLFWTLVSEGVWTRVVQNMAPCKKCGTPGDIEKNFCPTCGEKTTAGAD